METIMDKVQIIYVTDPCEHDDLDKHNVCLDCGKDLTEDLLANAYENYALLIEGE